MFDNGGFYSNNFGQDTGSSRWSNNNNNNQGGNHYNQQQMRRSKVFTPVTLRMVYMAQPRPDDVCEFDGDPISDVILVGRLLRLIEEPMRTQFEINDTTGSYHVLFYHKSENQVPTALRTFDYERFSYVKLFGNIRVFKDDRVIIGTYIKRVDKLEEITNHFLSVFVAHQIRKKGVLKARELAMDVGNTALDANPNAMTMVSSDARPAPKRPYQQPQLGEDQLRDTVVGVMREFLRGKKFVSKEEIHSMVQQCSMGQLEGLLARMKEDGSVAEAHDGNHFFLVGD